MILTIKKLLPLRLNYISSILQIYNNNYKINQSQVVTRNYSKLEDKKNSLVKVEGNFCN